MPKERNKADGYREKAYEGDTKAMNNRTWHWRKGQSRNGDGIEKDLSECAFWYELAANGGDAQAQFATGWPPSIMTLTRPSVRV